MITDEQIIEKLQRIERGEVKVKDAAAELGYNDVRALLITDIG